MGSTEGYDVVGAAIEGAARPLLTAVKALEEFGEMLVNATELVAGGAGEGPLAGALRDLGERAKERAGAHADECAKLAQALNDSAAEYRSTESDNAGHLGAVSFGGVTG